MELIEVIRHRRSVRKYTEDAIPDEVLEKLLQAGLLAPTSRNRRPWEFYVVKDKATLEKLSQAKAHGCALIAGCNAAIAVFADSELTDTWIEDSSIALAYMDLMASSQEIGSCWVQMRMRKDADDGDAEKNVQKILGVEDPFRIVGILALGVPAEQHEAYNLSELKWEKVHSEE